VRRFFSCVSAALIATFFLVVALFWAPGAQLLSNRGSVFATYVNLVLLNVTAHDKKTGLPLFDLEVRDLEILDNGKPAQVVFFRNGSDSSEPPINLWFVVGCSPSLKSETEFGFTRVKFVEHVLAKLNDQDAVGVARWCTDSGEAEVGLRPTADRKAPAEAMHAVLRRYQSERHGDASRGALQSVIHRIHASTSSPAIAPLTVLLFLGSDTVEAPRSDAEQVARDVLSCSGVVVYQMTEAPVHASKRTTGPGVSLISYLADETGGRIFPSEGDVYGEEFDKILAGIHSRYEIAFFPPPGDRQWHQVKVRLTATAISKYGAVALKYRRGYLNASPTPFYSVTETTKEVTASGISSPRQAAANSSPTDAIRFVAEGAAYEGPSTNARFTLKLDDEVLSWSALLNGKHSSRVTVTTAFLSDKGETIREDIRRYEVVRDKVDDWTVPQPIIVSIYSEFPASAAQVRFRIRDEMSGRTGSQDLSMQKVLEAPRLRSVIAGRIVIETPTRSLAIGADPNNDVREVDGATEGS
jgi:hypothetical protein